MQHTRDKNWQTKQPKPIWISQKTATVYVKDEQHQSDCKTKCIYGKTANSAENYASAGKSYG